MVKNVAIWQRIWFAAFLSHHGLDWAGPKTSFPLRTYLQKILIIHVLDFLAGWNWFSCDMFLLSNLIDLSNCLVVFSAHIIDASWVVTRVVIVHELKNIYMHSTYHDIWEISNFYQTFQDIDWWLPISNYLFDPVKVWLTCPSTLKSWVWGRGSVATGFGYIG